MKKWCIASVLMVCGAVNAQTASTNSAKAELIAKLLTLQQPAIEQTAQSLAERPALQMMQQADLALQSRVAPENREAVVKAIQADLKAYADDVGPLVRQKAIKLAPSTVGALLDQRFTEDELKQLIAIIESPVNRKYQQMGGDLQKALIEQLVTDTKDVVAPKVKALEQALIKHLNLSAAPAEPASKPAAGAKAAKK